MQAAWSLGPVLAVYIASSTRAGGVVASADAGGVASTAHAGGVVTSAHAGDAARYQAAKTGCVVK